MEERPQWPRPGASGRDDTKRERAEDALRKSEERYRNTVEQAVESIFLVDSENLRVLMSNVAFRRLLGYEMEDSRA